MGLSLFFSLHLQQNSGLSITEGCITVQCTVAHPFKAHRDGVYTAQWCYTVNCPSQCTGMISVRSIHVHCLVTLHWTLECPAMLYFTLSVTVQRSVTAHCPVNTARFPSLYSEASLHTGRQLCSGASLCNVQWTLSTVQWWRITVQWRSIPVHCSATLQCTVERHCTQSSDAPVYSVNDSTASGLTSPQQIKIKKPKSAHVCLLKRSAC